MIQLVLSIHTKSNELTFDKHNQLIPDYIVDTFYTQIKRCIDSGLDYSHFLRNLKRVNDNVIPPVIEAILPPTLSQVFDNALLPSLNRLDFLENKQDVSNLTMEQMVDYTMNNMEMFIQALVEVKSNKLNEKYNK
jgi:hypothetical protein